MTDLAVIEPEDAAPRGMLTLFGAASPKEVVTRTAEVADALADVLKSKKLFAMIQGKAHVTVEGWTLLGSMLGVFPVCTWTRKIDNGWEARVEARTKDGVVVGAAEAMCTSEEKRGPWKTADEYALRAMAQTRATSRALRQPLGFVVKLAGYEAAGAEEMPHE